MTDSIILMVIGPKHAGKTVFMTALANCPQIGVKDGSIDQLNTNWKKLMEGKTPPATAGSVIDLNYTLLYESEGKSYNIDFTVYDYDGHYVETLSNTESDDIKILRENIVKSDGFIVFMPVDEDTATMEELRIEICSFIDIARNVYDAENKIPVPVIITVNKWDKSYAFKNTNEDDKAREYINSIEVYKSIYDRLNVFFADITVIAISAYGHKSSSANPLPGAIRPYRLTEPVMLVARKFFKNFDSLVERFRRDGESVPLAARLLETIQLWRRIPDCDYQKILDQSLEDCFNTLKEKLSQAGTVDEFDDIWHDSEQRDLVNDFTCVQQGELRRMRFSLLVPVLGAAKTLKEYERIWKDATKIEFFNEFNPDQQRELQGIKDPLERADKNSKYKKVGAIVVIACVVGAILYLVSFVHDFDNAYQAAMNAGPSTQQGELEAFLDEYEYAFLSKTFYKGKLLTAREKLNVIIENLQETLNNGLTEIKNIPDSCLRESRARQLVELTDAQNLLPESRTSLDALLKESSEICEAGKTLETATSFAQLEHARSLLIGKPDSEELKAILQGISEKNEQIRVAVIQNEYSTLIETKDPMVAKDFLAQNARDLNPVVQELVANIKKALPEFYYLVILERAKSITGPEDPEYMPLRNFVSANISELKLSDPQKYEIRNILQEAFSRFDSEKIADLSTKITSEQELRDTLSKLNSLNDIFDSSLDGGLFVYDRTEVLQNRLSNIVNILNLYKNHIEKGIDVTLTLYATEENQIDIYCDKMFMKELPVIDTNPYIFHINPEDFSCKREDGGKGYIFYTVKPILVNQYEGNINLIRRKAIGNDKICFAGVDITSNDIIKLHNHIEVRKELGSGSCKGLTLQLSH